jgi:acetoin:2,6-dichlorophenolindophenol oxidoreductase subunit beta
VARTGRLLVVDAAWATCGVAAEIAATVAGELLDELQAPIARLTLPDAPAPTSPALESAYYIGATDIAASARALLQRGRRRRGLALA